MEHPRRRRLVVRRESVEHYTVRFPAFVGFRRWRAPAGTYFYFATPPGVEHTRTALSG
ncbi:hypothetical protein GCM10014715_80970 [Streptomyces spiralis]|uniref:Uncharacterized protein n=1 Tax=Streptomyces spiralis TaxID=66376 RepID=A0A919E4V5_9ACTN|nr:hypothetical protein [Streptomyces spiralis]GHF13235.1 hypothetical protein GCM10014715_80970 [Streptomyces spiralis]